MAVPVSATAVPALRSANAQGDAIVIEAHGGEAFVPGPPGFIVGADYARSGWDLKLADKDGHEAVIKDFFKLEHPPELVSPEGAHIPAELAMRLAGPLAPGQYAQATPGAGNVPIGQVQTVQGAATATHTDGTKVALAVGAPIFQGDILETGRGGAMGIVFVDKTTFAMQDDSRMVIDRLIFDPGSKQGSQVFSLLQGAFVAVTGEIAQTNPQAVTVNTPVAAIGIRGTEFAVVISQQLGQTLFTLLAGAISVSNALGQVVLNTAGLTTLGTSFNAPPAPPFTLPQAQFNTLYGAGAAITEQLRPFGVRPQQQQQQQNQNQPNPNELQQVQSTEPAAGQDQQGQAGANKTFGASKVFGDLAGLTDLQVASGLGLGPDSGFKFGESNPQDFVGEGGDRHQLFFIPEPTAESGPPVIEILPGNNPGQAIVRDGTEIIVDSPNEIPAIIGSSGNDTLIVRDLSGTAFANSVIFFFGNGGNDILSAEQATNPIVADGGPGNDVFISGSGNDTLTGGTGVDTLSGGAGNDVFIWHVGDGNDTIHGDAGTDQLVLAAGPLLGTTFTINPDNAGGTFTVTVGTDTLLETVQADSVEQIVVVGGAGADVLNGAATHHDVVVTGAGGNDTLTTGSGNDVFIWNAGDGNDTINGNAGTDHLVLVADPALATTFTVSALVAGAFTASDGTDTVQAQGIEQIIMFGGAGADTLDAATSLDVTASGGGGNDVLTTGSGDDRFIWQVGDGNDLLQGGAGTDVLEVDSDPAGTTFAVSGTNIGGTFTVDDGVSTITANGVEQLDIVGGAGIDIVDAAQADVTIRAFGGGGADTITTGAAADLLAGGAGADTMAGNDGDDIYIVDNVGDKVIEHPNGGTDTVLSSIDYTLGNNVENLGLGEGNLVGTGNSLNNIIGVFDVSTLLGLGGGSGGGSGGGIIAPGFESNVLPANDDGSVIGAVSMGFTVNFFGQSYDNLYVNNNGNVTFTSPLGTFTPFGLGAQYIGQPIIAPFFADVDTTGIGSGVVSYGTGTFEDHAAFGVNWPLVGYYSASTDKLNDFQLILVDRSDVAAGDFDIYFNYDQVQWETGSASGGIGGLGGTSAAAGYSVGTGDPGTFYELPGSLIPGSLIDGGTDALTANTNDGFTGQYLFQVRAGDVTQNDVGIPGDKTLFGLAGDDTLSGGIGNDTLDGGTDNDMLSGGAGSDTASFAWTTAGVTVDLNTNTAVGSESGTDQLSSIESVIGGSGDDTMFGGTGNDTFNGGDGSDFLEGHHGSDTLVGGAGADIYGFDDPGNIAGAQNGDGFVVTTNRVKAAGENGDFIVGFQSGTDVIDFSADFGLEGNFFSTIAGPYDGTNAGANQQWSAGQAALIYSTADQTLYYDANGAAGGYQVVATVQSGDHIQAADVTTASVGT